MFPNAVTQALKAPGVLSANRTLRSRLNSILRSDGATVADYDASLGITGTLNASAWANQIGAAGSLAQATGGNQPIVLPFVGQKYAYLPGVSGNYSSTPNAAANQITGDIDIRVQLAADTWSPAAEKTIISKYGAAGHRSWAFNVLADGTLRFYVSSDGTAAASVISTASLGFAAGSLNWARVTRAATSGNTNFYTSADGVSWTLLGTGDQVLSAGVSIFDSDADIELGASVSGTSSLLAAKFYRAQLYNGINGTPAVDFNAADWSETSTNGATQASTTGETWTLNNTGAKPAQIVASASLLADGTASKMATANFTLDQPFTEYFVAKQITWTAGDYLSSGTAGAAGITSVTGTPKIGLNAGAAAAENAGATLGAYHVLTAVFDGASSSLAVDSAAAATGNAGAGNPGGLSLFSDNAGANYGNWQVKRRIVRSGSDAAATQAQIKALLKAIYGTP